MANQYTPAFTMHAKPAVFAMRPRLRNPTRPSPVGEYACELHIVDGAVPILRVRVATGDNAEMQALGKLLHTTPLAVVSRNLHKYGEALTACDPHAANFTSTYKIIAL